MPKTSINLSKFFPLNGRREKWIVARYHPTTTISSLRDLSSRHVLLVFLPSRSSWKVANSCGFTLSHVHLDIWRDEDPFDPVQHFIKASRKLQMQSNRTRLFFPAQKRVIWAAWAWRSIIHHISPEIGASPHWQWRRRIIYMTFRSFSTLLLMMIIMMKAP